MEEVVLAKKFQIPNIAIRGSSDDLFLPHISREFFQKYLESSRKPARGLTCVNPDSYLWQLKWSLIFQNPFLYFCTLLLQYTVIRHRKVSCNDKQLGLKHVFLFCEVRDSFPPPSTLPLPPLHCPLKKLHSLGHKEISSWHN